MAKGLKYDTDKPPLGLLPRSALVETARVLQFGAQKYSAHNWRRGIEFQRLIDAALRHIFAYNEGEDLDPETGISHIAHAVCELMFLIEMAQSHPELDNRWRGEPTEHGPAAVAPGSATTPEGDEALPMSVGTQTPPLCSCSCVSENILQVDRECPTHGDDLGLLQPIWDAWQESHDAIMAKPLSHFKKTFEVQFEELEEHVRAGDYTKAAQEAADIISVALNLLRNLGYNPQSAAEVIRKRGAARFPGQTKAIMEKYNRLYGI